MAFPLTNRALTESQEQQLTPNIVLEIDGVEEVYGAFGIRKFIRIGDEDLEIGNEWVIGGYNLVEDQSPYISYQSGTSTTIGQTLNVDKGFGEGVSSMKVSIVDKNGEITRDLLTPGAVVPDIMGRKCKIWLGFPETAFKDDYIVIFRGVITQAQSSPGLVTFNINSPETKKNSEIFIKAETELTANLSAGATVADVVDTTDFLTGVLGPDGTIDSDLQFGLRINDEIMFYTGKTGTQFSGLVRGGLSTTAASHSSGDSCEAFIRIGPSNVIDLALKLLLSGKEGAYLEAQEVTNFVRTIPTETVANSIYIKGTDLVLNNNIVIGDYITTTGATDGANNVSGKQINGITINNDGDTILTVADVSFVEETGTAAVMDIRSQYDVWPTNAGLALDNDEVDIAEHLLIKSRFLSSPEMDFYIKDSVNGKEFLAEQIYNPVAAFSLPRKSQASLGFHSPPIPGTNIKILTDNNVKNAKDLKITRATTKNFFNGVIYKFDENPLEEEFNGGVFTLDTDSQDRIPVGNKVLEIEAKGFRTLLSAVNIGNQATSRRLKKYKFAAESIPNVKVNFKTGFDLEVGDIVVFNLEDLKTSDIVSGTRKGEPRLFQIDQKKLNLKTGDVEITIVDTNFNKDARFGLISPCSFIGPDATTTSFNLKPSFNTDRFGINEARKWENYIGAQIIVRSSDFTFSETRTIKTIVGNKVTLDSALSVAPSEDYAIELALYTGQTDLVKLIFAFMNDTAFPDSGIQYGMI